MIHTCQWFRFIIGVFLYIPKNYFRSYQHSKFIFILIFTMCWVWYCFWIGRRRVSVNKTTMRVWCNREFRLHNRRFTGNIIVKFKKKQSKFVFMCLRLYYKYQYITTQHLYHYTTWNTNIDAHPHRRVVEAELIPNKR